MDEALEGLTIGMVLIIIYAVIVLMIPIYICQIKCYVKDINNEIKKLNRFLMKEETIDDKLKQSEIEEHLLIDPITGDKRKEPWQTKKGRTP